MSESSDKLLLSICIPVYNRAELLRETLEAVAGEKAFADGLVEIVISNNASTDHTPQVAMEFQQKYPDRVYYSELTEAIDTHFNFQNALSFGHGKFIKLQTDHSRFRAGDLDKFLEAIREYGDRVSFIVPRNFRGRDDRSQWLDNPDELLSYCSFYITSIDLLCVRREDYLKLENPFRAWETAFPQVDILLRLASQRPGICISNIFFEGRVLYNHLRNEAKLFARNYIGLLLEFQKNGLLTRKNVQREKRLVLFGHTLRYHFDFLHELNSCEKIQPFWEHTVHYRKDWFLYAAYPCIALWFMATVAIPVYPLLKKLKRMLKK